MTNSAIEIMVTTSTTEQRSTELPSKSSISISKSKASSQQQKSGDNKKTNSDDYVNINQHGSKIKRGSKHVSRKGTDNESFFSYSSVSSSSSSSSSYTISLLEDKKYASPLLYVPQTTTTTKIIQRQQKQSEVHEKQQHQQQQNECPPPLQVSMENFQRIGQKGTEVRGLIVPSQRQRQLMRQVSGLGLEDPVFDNSDRTDVVDHDRITVGEEGKLSDSTKATSNFTISIPRPPLGLCGDKKRPTLDETIHSHSPSIRSDPNYVPSHGSFRSRATPSSTARTRERKLPRKLPRSSLNSTTHSYSAPSIISEPTYDPPSGSFKNVPPNGSFKMKKITKQKTRRNSNDSAATRISHDDDDDILASQVNEILSMNDSFASFDVASIATASASVAMKNRKVNRSVPNRQDSRLSTSSKSSSKYVPPPALHHNH
ncbi:hypothetical protein FRACYDRAFT_238652 [Fragilariopsis cylindrus CCMP1102]|uniref:Uncharacterized protein n=1 Tax=Fragilariopsis cylindrus CCMP1102 TaxID=635003 RepID=A0A1E7FD63_9STRA|nr:hypothetical protein FRACYDRAFT_238652 [Fragilariopsis cylindrus CCMP1102]|eukprot:OEU16066.1 hypothetical protein FRACYDRAFT_238652 [Fragilariopsis cylindrus CCMP1102]